MRDMPAPPTGSGPLVLWAKQILRYLERHTVTDIVGAKRRPNPHGGVAYDIQFPKVPAAQSGIKLTIGYVLAFNAPAGQAGSGNFIRCSENFDGTGDIVQVAKPMFLREGFYLPYPGRTFTYPDGVHTYALVDSNTRNDTCGTNTFPQIIWPPYSVGDAILYADFGSDGKFEQYAPPPVTPLTGATPGLLVNLMDLNTDYRQWVTKWTVCDKPTGHSKFQYVPASMPF